MQQSLQEFVTVPLTPPEAALAPSMEAPAPSLGRTGLAGRLALAEWLLKHRDALLDQIESGSQVGVILADLLLIGVVPAAAYGLILGMATGSPIRMLTNPFKLPLVLFLSLCLCLPTLYIFSSFLGGRRSFLQTAALAFTGLAILGVVLAAFAPISWFLAFTAPGAYGTHVLFNVAVFALAGFMGVSFLIKGARRLYGGSPQLRAQVTFLWSWIVLYGLVGAQMGWIFRPFFSNSAEVIRPHSPGDSTVFEAVAILLRNALGL